MADLNDFAPFDFTKLTPDEAIEHLRLIRLSRNVPVKKTKSTTTSPKKAAAPKMSKDAAAELLKLLGGI